MKQWIEGFGSGISSTSHLMFCLVLIYGHGWPRTQVSVSPRSPECPRKDLQEHWTPLEWLHHPSTQVFSDPQMCWCTLRYSISPIIIYDFLLEYHQISSSVAEKLLPIWSSWTTVMMKGCIIENHRAVRPWSSLNFRAPLSSRAPWFVCSSQNAIHGHHCGFTAALPSQRTVLKLCEKHQKPWPWRDSQDHPGESR